MVKENLLNVLSIEELFEINGGWNWENFTYCVATIGVIGAVVCPPVAVVSGVYEASYWLTRAIIE